MRRHHLAPLAALWLLAGASAAHAAVPVGDDGSLRPRDGAELIEAAAELSASGPPVTIVLGRGDYEIDRTIVLNAGPGDRFTGDSAGETRIRGTASATTLLRADGPATVENVALFPAPEAAPGPYPLVELNGGASFENTVVAVPDALTNVTAIDATDASLVGVEAESLASGGPVLHAGGQLDVDGSSLTGGNPTVDLDAGSTRSRTAMSRAFLSGGPSTDSVLLVRSGSAATSVGLQESVIRAGDAEAPKLVNLAGSTGVLGSTTFDAQRSTFSGPPESTTLRAATGLELLPTVATLGGVLALGSATTVDCGASALLGPVVTITGIYRTGDHVIAPGSSCSIVETGRRSGGDPALTTDRGLKWGSPAIDAIARPLLVTQDAFRSERTSSGPNTPSLTPTDLGAVEYQYLPPSLDEAIAEPQEDGTVRFSVSASDGNEDEGELLTVVWRFPDGTTATGTSVTHRFAAGTVGQATVTATDPSGLEAQLTVSATPPLGDPTLGPVDDPTPTPNPTPTPTPTPSPTPQQTLPELVTLPKGSGGDQSPLTSDTPALRTFTRTSPRTGRFATRRSGLGVAMDGEAGLKLDLASAANITVLARRRVGTRLVTVPNARFSIDVSAGVITLHLTPRVGTAKLRTGLYRFTVLVRPVKGIGARRDLFVRVVR